MRSAIVVCFCLQRCPIPARSTSGRPGQMAKTIQMMLGMGVYANGTTLNMYLADMVSTFLTQIMDDLDRHPLEAADDVAAAAELVPPMYRVCFPHFQKPKQGWVATAPGSVLEFDVATDITPGNESFIGSASVAAAIVYLSSYEHMGQAEVSCVEGCTCQSKTLNGHMTGLGTQQSIMLVELSLAARCRLRVMVLPDTSSGEHKVKVTGIIVSETSGWLIRDDVEVQPFRMFES
ncbi:hypothetical protein ACK3TF_003052 [Chlorella vulgaris]